MQPTAFDIRQTPLASLRALFFDHHAYKSVSKTATYSFGVFEEGALIAAYVWQPPAYGAALSVAPECTSGVLALSRMVAVPKQARKLKHISKPLMWQMKHGIDRTRWPVLVTYSDEGLGHTGYVYKCSGWTPTERREARQYVNAEGARTSVYSSGKTSAAGLTKIGTAWLQRWEHWACTREQSATWLQVHGWKHEPIPNKYWRSGSPAYRWVRAV
jgi:hypothetical protein